MTKQPVTRSISALLYYLYTTVTIQSSADLAFDKISGLVCVSESFAIYNGLYLNTRRTRSPGRPPR